MSTQLTAMPAGNAAARGGFLSYRRNDHHRSDATTRDAAAAAAAVTVMHPSSRANRHRSTVCACSHYFSVVGRRRGRLAACRTRVNDASARGELWQPLIGAPGGKASLVLQSGCVRLRPADLARPRKTPEPAREPQPFLPNTYTPGSACKCAFDQNDMCCCIGHYASMLQLEMQTNVRNARRASVSSTCIIPQLLPTPRPLSA